MQEVLRFYPFLPAIGARACEPVGWHGHASRPGDWLLLGIYGTNRHPELRDEPDAFRPERLRDWHSDRFSLIPQGGGNHATDQRCPGEWLTIELTKEAVRSLTRQVRIELPPQDLSVGLLRFPALPDSGILLSKKRGA